MKLSFAFLALTATAVLAAPTPDSFNKRDSTQANIQELQQAASSYEDYASQIRSILSEIQQTRNQIAGSLDGSSGSSINDAQDKVIGSLDTSAQELSNIAASIGELVSSYQDAESGNNNLFE